MRFQLIYAKLRKTINLSIHAFRRPDPKLATISYLLLPDLTVDKYVGAATRILHRLPGHLSMNAGDFSYRFLHSG